MKPYTFSDGATVPKGSLIIAQVAPVHRDESIYENATVFDAFRFSNLRNQPGEGSKHRASSIGVDLLHFGYGLHAWY